MVYPRIEIIKYKNKMRLNPETGDRFRHGDLREDGFVFDHYNMGVVRNGYFNEQWRSPKKFKKKYKELIIKVNKWLNNKKLRKGCQHCGYRKHAIALVFHHTDPSKKEGEINKMKKNTLNRFKKIVLETWKCIVLCANCHNVEHQRLRDNKKNNG